MSWHTIFIEKPDPSLVCQKNCAGQFILFDGNAPRKEILERARAASLSCEEATVFSGKSLGKLISTFRKGNLECSYCGKAHL